MNPNDELCDRYMFYRPIRRGTNTMGRTGAMWGDPHFGTLDGFSYTFNGYGEYIYLAITNNTSTTNIFNENQSFLVLSQIRTVPIKENNQATITTGFTGQSYSIGSQPISITISQRNQLILHRGKQLIDFENNINSLSLPELIITKLDKNPNAD